MHKPLAILAVTASALVAQSTSVPTTTPSTTPTTQAASSEQSNIELSGYFAPVNAQEIKPKLKRFAGGLKVLEVVPFGSSVKTGQRLIRFDLSDLEQEILEATSDLDVAKAGQAKTEVDLSLGERQDAATLKEKTDALADAEAGVAWWRDIEGPDYLKRLDMAVEGAQDGIDDQNDELDQLRKMYKSEELTNATADIVVKRAVRGLARAKEAIVITRHSTDKQKATDYKNQQLNVERALVGAKIALDDTNATIAQSKVTRTASLLKARDAVRDAQKKLTELEEDKAALDDIKASHDGVVYYGGFKDGAWQGAEKDALKIDEKVDADKPVLTVLQPGKLKVVAKLDEAHAFAVHSGDAAVVTPAALPDAKLGGKLGTRQLLAGPDGSFDQDVEVSDLDPKLLPGMKAKVEIGEAK